MNGNKALDEALIKELQQEIDHIKDSRSRYAKYFNAFCLFLKHYGVEPLHSDNSIVSLEKQLHTVVETETARYTEVALAEILRWAKGDDELLVRRIWDSVRLALLNQTKD